MEDKLLVSKMEVGLMETSESEELFGENPTKRAGDGKSEEDLGLLQQLLPPMGDGKEWESDIRACFSPIVLDLFLNISISGFGARILSPAPLSVEL